MEVLPALYSLVLTASYSLWVWGYIFVFALIPGGLAGWLIQRLRGGYWSFFVAIEVVAFVAVVAWLILVTPENSNVPRDWTNLFGNIGVIFLLGANILLGPPVWLAMKIGYFASSRFELGQKA